jgi:hypothetical protein
MIFPYACIFQVFSSLQIYLQKCTHFSYISPARVLQAMQSCSFSLDHAKNIRCITLLITYLFVMQFSLPFVLPLFRVHTFSLAPCSQTLSIYLCVPPLKWMTILHTHTTVTILHILVITFFDSRRWKKKILNWRVRSIPETKSWNAFVFIHHTLIVRKHQIQQYWVRDLYI